METKQGLKCTVCKAGLALDTSLVHSALMSVSYRQVCRRDVWRILRLLHRSHMNLLCSEMYAEHVGSILRYFEKRHAIGRSLTTESLTQAVMLRTIRLTGGMECMAFVKAALKEHFGSNPLHYFVTTRTRKRKARADEASGIELLGVSPTLQRLRRVPWIIDGLMT